MYSEKNYEDLLDYSVKLSDILKVFDEPIFLYSTPPKQWGSFKSSINLLRIQLSNIEEVREILDKIQMMPYLDAFAKKDSKDARKVSEAISDIRRDLYNNFDRMQNEYIKQLEVCHRQYMEVSKAITNKEDKERFTNEKAIEFRIMMHETNNIPFNKSDDFSEYNISKAHSEHRSEEDKIDASYEFKKEETNDLEQALNEINLVLQRTAGDKLWRQVRKEVEQIKKVFPPKTVIVSKEILEKLRHSEQLVLDLEKINELLKTNFCFNGKDGKLIKINKKLDILEKLVSNVLKNEREKSMQIRSEYDDIQERKDFATQAVNTYSKILSGNAQLEQEKIQINNGNHTLAKENERLKNDERRSLEEIDVIRNIPMDDRTMQQTYRLESLNKKVDQDREFMRNNNQYMSDKLEEEKVTELPLEYTQMKEKLKNMSSLNQIGMSQSYDLSTGGRLR
ncbi:MAG: hypothetical protein E7170_03715 [Firmicutes bacterium]|nr:hypothetical protein [Bacillota bacterium]